MITFWENPGHIRSYVCPVLNNNNDNLQLAINANVMLYDCSCHSRNKFSK